MQEKSVNEWCTTANQVPRIVHCNEHQCIPVRHPSPVHSVCMKQHITSKEAKWSNLLESTEKICNMYFLPCTQFVISCILVQETWEYGQGHSVYDHHIHQVVPVLNTKLSDTQAWRQTSSFRILPTIPHHDLHKCIQDLKTSQKKEREPTKSFMNVTC